VEGVHTLESKYQLTIIIMTLGNHHTASYHNARGVTVHSIVTASASPPLGLKEKSHFEKDKNNYIIN